MLYDAISCYMMLQTLANLDLWLLLAKIFNPTSFNTVIQNSFKTTKIAKNILNNSVFMVKVNRHSFPVVQIVLHQMQSSKTI